MTPLSYLLELISIGNPQVYPSLSFGVPFQVVCFHHKDSSHRN